MSKEKTLDIVLVVLTALVMVLFGKLFGGGFVSLFGTTFGFKQCDGQTERL